MLKALLKIRDNLEAQLESPRWNKLRADIIQKHRDVNLMVVEAGGRSSRPGRRPLYCFHGLLH